MLLPLLNCLKESGSISTLTKLSTVTAPSLIKADFLAYGIPLWPVLVYNLFTDCCKALLDPEETLSARLTYVTYLCQFDLLCQIFLLLTHYHCASQRALHPAHPVPLVSEILTQLVILIADVNLRSGVKARILATVWLVENCSCLTKAKVVANIGGVHASTTVTIIRLWEVLHADLLQQSSTLVA